MSNAALPQPPYADREPSRREFHGDVFEDPFAWMRRHDDPRLLELVKAENAYTEALTSHLEQGTQTLFEELRSRIVEDDVSVPVRIDRWWYYSRTVTGQQYEIYCRALYADDAPPLSVAPGQVVEGEQVLLDGNAEAADAEFFELGALEPDPAGERLAVLADRTGGELFDLQIRQIATGEVLDEAVQQVGYELVWSVDGRYVFYGRRDEAWRSFQIWRHEVGQAADTDVLVMDEPDELFSLGAEVSQDDRWLIITSSSRTTSEVHLLDLSDPTGSPRIVQPRTKDLDYSVEVDGDRILMVHNGSRVDFDLCTAPLGSPGREHWSEPILTAGPGDRILAVVPTSGFLAIAMRHDGLGTVRLLPKEGAGFGPVTDVPTDSPIARIRLGNNPTYDVSSVQVITESLIQPRTVLEVAPGAAPNVRKRQQVPGYDAARYTERRLWVTARDGVLVPVSLAYRKDLAPDGTNPGWLYGYGSYEWPIDPAFSAGRVSMLDRGVVYAIAHIRGGGELGRGWYDDGKLLRKANTFHDFVDCARALVDEGWVASDRLVAEGGSAGGLLIGAAINEAPEVFAAVQAAVPFVDALTTILDPTLPLTVGEWEEWGNPIEDPAVYACMKSYTPYENIRHVRYPAILATTSVNDTRVSFVEPLKWVQALREQTDYDATDRPIVMKTEIVAGHAGSSGRYDAWKQQSFETAFLLNRLGVL